MDEAKAKRIAGTLVWLPLEADSNDGLEDILNDEQLDIVVGRIVAALMNPDAYDTPLR